MKAYVYETFEQLGRIPANIVIPVGNGTLFIGAVKALEHLHASGAIERDGLLDAREQLFIEIRRGNLCLQTGEEAPSCFLSSVK